MEADLTARIVRLSDYWHLREKAPVVDLLTAVDVAIRDLDDVVSAWGSEQARQQATHCRDLLRAAFSAAKA